MSKVLIAKFKKLEKNWRKTYAGLGATVTVPNTGEQYGLRFDGCALFALLYSSRVRGDCCGVDAWDWHNDFDKKLLCNFALAAQQLHAALEDARIAQENDSVWRESNDALDALLDRSR